MLYSPSFSVSRYLVHASGPRPSFSMTPVTNAYTRRLPGWLETRLAQITFKYLKLAYYYYYYYYNNYYYMLYRSR